ncbi:phage major capsid protein [Paracoccus salipaludis]|uniref:Phage major capsid protein n=4 Tax=Paracoccus salipaludis TaxID=2032623 RepID=A0A2A2GC02_9RHOB|nr:phage major capsid protein [Paracoccus salipaludis]
MQPAPEGATLEDQMKLHELQEARSRTIAKMRALTDKAETETRDLSDTESAEFGTLKDEVRALDGKIDRAKFLAEAERSAPAIVHNGTGDGRFEDRARDFSLVRAIGAAMGEDVDAGFEREMSAEVKRRSGRKFQGIAVPDQYFTRTMLTTGAAAPLYPTQHRADLYIDMLRDALVIGRLGATVLDNLVGDQDIPKQTGSATAQWVAEDQPLTETDLTFDDVTLSPHTVGALTSYSRRTLINAVPGIEDIVRRDLAYVIAAAIDKAALIGDGTGNTPVGVVNAEGVHNLTLATPSRAEALAMPMAVLSANAAFGNLGWALSPAAAAVLMNTMQVTGDAGGGYIMDGGQIAGYGHALTNALPNGTAIFGAWSQLLVGYWSGTDILVNPFADEAYRRGRVMVRAMRDVDVGVRHGESFAVADDVTAVPTP